MHVVLIRKIMSSSKEKKYDPRAASRRRIFEAAVLIMSGTIGAGILGMPYAVAKVGVLVGMFWIVFLGLVMMFLHLLFADVISTIKEPVQLAGIAERYLGKVGKWVMTTIFYFMLFGVLVAYIIGEGYAFSAIIGGSPFWWSCLFWSIATCLIAIGMKSIKVTELVLTSVILFVVLLVASSSLPYLNGNFARAIDMSQFFFPYGIILFAFHGVSTIPEVESAITKAPRDLHRGILYSSIIVMTVYLLFSALTVAVTGPGTTEVASVGLGQKIGPIMIIFGNLFAALAMGTSALMVGICLRDSLKWDFGVHRLLAILLVAVVPFTIFILGIRHFITLMDLIGGIFVSLELLLILFIYLRARKQIEWQGLTMWYHNVWIVGLLFVVCGAGFLYSLNKLF